MLKPTTPSLQLQPQDVPRIQNTQKAEYLKYSLRKIFDLEMLIKIQYSSALLLEDVRFEFKCYRQELLNAKKYKRRLFTGFEELDQLYAHFCPKIVEYFVSLFQVGGMSS